MFRWHLPWLVLLVLPALRTHAQESIYLYNRDTGEQMRVKALYARTVVEGPLARTQLHYVIANPFDKRTEVSLNLHLPQDTLLVGFAYYYQNRLITGKMYDKQEAWKIYQAVTSRGRDPGVMDRPSTQDYHAQIFPVEPKQDLKVEITLTQVIGSDAQGLFVELPLSMYDTKALYAQLRTEWIGATAAELRSNYQPHLQTWQEGDRAIMRMANNALEPTRNWRVRIPRPGSGTLTMVSGGFTRDALGYYLLWISPDRALDAPRARLLNRIGTHLSMPTAFGEVPRYGRIYIAGTYAKVGSTTVVLRDRQRRRLTIRADLPSGRLAEGGAGPLWADKRIDQLQNSYRKDWRPQIIALSKNFNVVSNFTALLAIPEEELQHYREVLAKQQISTNTDAIGGGGGDPWIAVKAPADAQQVVAVFPNGEAKTLRYDESSEAWRGRFDFPFGTAPGSYRVIIVVVHADGMRNRFVLEYQNLLGGTLQAESAHLRAHAGQPFTVRVSGEGIRRAVAVAPWGERSTLSGSAGTHTGTLTVPGKWAKGASTVTVVLLDGAHNRTEITLDLQVE